ncbi:MAG: AGE family epimerase/isomerase [Bacteroidales bacterium]
MKLITWTALVLGLLLGLDGCNRGRQQQTVADPLSVEKDKLANELEASLFQYILEPWYPRDIDSVNGGYISGFERDWSRSRGGQVKALVQQARHVWTTSFVKENYPEMKEYLGYAGQGFRFLRDMMWDKEAGGFHAYCSENGAPVPESLNDKRVYGQAFAVYALSQYYLVSRDEEALALVKRQFQWMEDGPHDPVYGGYFEFLNREGKPAYLDPPETSAPRSPMIATKDYNSSIHLMEALTQLYRVWPDPLVRTRLEEMFYLIRDTFVHPDGYLQLYFHADWSAVEDDNLENGSGGQGFFTKHFTYGHDVETAYLLLETAHVLGWGGDEKTHRIAKKLVDHSLASGWDHKNGGFFDAGRQDGDSIVIINDHKSWWGLVEGMNALLLMHTLYPDDPADYFGKFRKAWEHIDTYLIDKEYGGWYNSALDTDPESIDQPKSHIWKTTYHNTRGMINCIHMLLGESELQTHASE